MEFATLHFDTYKIVKLLQDKGYSELEAEGFIEAIQEVTISGVSTKQDFYELKQEIQDSREEANVIRAELKQEIQELRAELIQEIQQVENRLNNKIMDLENKLIKIIFANTFIVVTILAAIMKLF